ncbi:MAG: methyltransferase domain-containing protein [Nanoarchaeota archaeon]
MTNLRSTLKNKLRQEEIPKSFDIIGSIAIFSKFPSNLKKQKLIANTILKLNKNIKTVLLKTNKVSGKYRLQKFKFLAGLKTKETIHKESSCLFKLDVEKCYFSPRLSHERLRISNLVKNNEVILVMFSGVGIYPIIISKHSKAKEIYAVEMNHVAVDYTLDNLKLNKIDNIKLFNGNVNHILPKLKHKFDRIVMPAPKNASNYLNLIKNKIKKNTVIHFYDFCNEKDFPDVIIKKIKKHFKKIKILKIVKCGNISPYNYRICVDFKIL